MFSHDILKKRILIFGSNGMLGQRTAQFYLSKDNFELLGASVEEQSVNPELPYKKVDLTKREEVKKVALDFCPDFIINAAAFTAVDRCEIERETSWKVNVKGVEYISEAARVLDSHVIHFSTDYVFDGKNGPYSEKDKPNPVSYYGRTKLASENALNISGAMHTIFRINVLYGVAPFSRPDYVRWVVSSLRQGNKINIVTDQINNPTFIDDIVQAINKIVDLKKTGIFNIGGREFLSRYDFTLRIADFFRLEKSLINPIITEELNQPARRPLKSGLLTIKAETQLGFKPAGMEDSFNLMKQELKL